jgi:hypothetical protein
MVIHRFDGERVMSKSNDSSNLGHAKLDHRPLADSELDAVSGGRGRYQLQHDQAHELLKVNQPGA